MWRLINIDQDEHDAGGGAGGAGASQDGANGAGAGAAEAAGAAAAQGVADDGAANPAAGTNGKTSQKAAWEQDEIVWNGQKKTMSRQEILDAAQRGYNVTQREQEIAQLRKEYNARLQRLDAALKEAEAGGKAPEGEVDPIDALKKDLEETKTKLLIQDWERAFNPVAAKYPDLSEDHLLTEFQAKVKAGEVDDSAAGLMKVAEGMANEREGTVNQRLEKLLADKNNPRLKTIREQAIADYLADKSKKANAGGDNPQGGAGAGKEKQPDSIAAAAAKVRQAIGSSD